MFAKFLQAFFENIIVYRNRVETLPPPFRFNLACVALVRPFRRAEITPSPRARLSANWLDAVSRKTGLAQAPRDRTATRSTSPKPCSTLVLKLGTIKKNAGGCRITADLPFYAEPQFLFWHYLA